MNRIPFFFRPRFRLFYDKLRYPLLKTKFKIGSTEMGEALGANHVIFQSKALSEKLGDLSKYNHPLKIAFITLGGSYGMYVDYVLAEALRAAGHQVIFFVDDACLPLFEGHQWDKPETWKRTSFRGYFVIRKILEKAGFSFLGFSDVQNSRVKDEDAFPEDFSDILEASLLRHYRVGILDNSLEDYARRKQLFEKAISISANVGETIVRENFNRVIINHGLYSSTGPARRIIQNAGIPVLTHDRAKRKNCLNFTWNQSSDKWDISEVWKKVKEIPLTPEQNRLTDEYLQSRISHSGDRLVYNFGEKETAADLAKRLGIDLKRPVFSLFTNVLWDAASSQREIVFKNPIEWVVETIKWFKSHPELQLLVKVHPAEVVIGTRQSFIGVLKDHLNEMPENVVLIPPDDKINSWSVYEITDLGIVHTTTAGMEMPLVDVPVIVVSNTHYRGKGFTIDVKNKREYFQSLLSFASKENSTQGEVMNLAKKYAYYLFQEYQFEFPFFYEPMELQIKGIDISEEGLKTLEYINNRIEKTSPLMNSYIINKGQNFKKEASKVL